jgi:hypothetical protein
LVKNIRVTSKVPSLKTGNPFTVNNTQPLQTHKSTLLPHEKWILIIIGIVIFIAILANLGGKSPDTLPPPPPKIAANPVEDIAGFWQLKDTCDEGKLQISASGTNFGMLKRIYSDVNKNRDERITSAERLPGNKYKLLTTSVANPAYRYETIFVKSSINSVKVDRYIKLAPERQMMIINGKFLENEEEIDDFKRCM